MPEPPFASGLAMGAQMLPDAVSADVIGEIRGREKPEEVVVIGGHIDSWDVGQGAHDDGTGITTCMQAAALIQETGAPASPDVASGALHQ